MYRLFYVLTFISLAGCQPIVFNTSGIFGATAADTVIPVKSPTGSKMKSYIAEFSGLNQSDSNITIRISSDYIYAGFSYVDRHCENYFNALEARRRRVGLRRDVISASVSQSVAILLRLSKNLAASYVNAAGVIGNAFFANYQENYNYSNHSIELRRLTKEAHSAQRAKILANIDMFSGELSDGTHFFRAHAQVQEYASKCTPAQFDQFISSALGNSAAKPSVEAESKKVAPTQGASTDATVGAPVVAGPKSG